MGKHWIEALVVLAALAGAASAAPPDTAADPAPAVDPVVPGTVLQPATGLDPEVDGEPFPQHYPDPCPPPPKGLFTIYGGGYLLQPTYQTDPAFVRTTPNAVRQVDFGRHINYAPLAGIGFTTRHNWGLRSRWFSFAESGSEFGRSEPGETLSAVSPFAVGNAPAAGVIGTASELKLNSWDMEGTYLCRYAQWSLLLGTGVRYVHISQDYAAVLNGFNGTTIAAQSGHNFNGVGPTFSADGRLPLREGRFALYSNLRFSILIGEDRESYAAQDNNTTIAKAQSQFDVLPIGELEVGAEYSWFHRRYRFWVQSGFVGQVWWGAGNSSNVDPVAGTTASNSNLGLFGVAFRGGWDF